MNSKNNVKKEITEAAALKYNPKVDKAPKLVAVGKGDIAENIIEIAKENSVPLYQDTELAHILGFLDLGSEIPEQLYEVVAKILVFVGNIDKKYGEEFEYK